MHEQHVERDFKNLNEGFSQGKELSFITDFKQEGTSVANSPAKEDKQEDSDIEKDQQANDWVTNEQME
jgi:hypothetical protein